ncbi:MAG: TIR domain-containing protein [Gammaproteobacteria bacterium]|nr:TIR domain-containing protein [Gammaproteobacteria bacterium]MDE2272958.1 TIR domain-containing protein [Gammaproteobacteria bacterium]
MADVFVSYARADKARVAPLVAAIEAKGWSVWWDPEITPGQEFDDQIDAEINAAKAVLVVWTPTSVTSRWVRGEAREAAERGILVPVRFEQARLPMDVRAIHTTDLDNWREDPANPAVQECLYALGAMIARAQVAESAKAASAAAASTATNIERFSICVLPFINMSGDPEQEYFSDGITEDIITDLSKISALEVVSRNDSFLYKGKQIEVLKVAHEAKVSHVLEGSVRRAGGRVRITAQLIDGASSKHLWAERYDRDANDIFALQDEISQAIVKALKLRLLPEEKKAIERRGTDSAEAHDLYLMARQTYATSQEDVRSAQAIVRLCTRATEIDPKYTQAWALMAMGYRSLRELGVQSDDGMTAAERALALNPDLAEAHAVKAYILLMKGDTDAASSEIDIALKLDPESYEANRSAGRLNYLLHRWKTAIHLYEKTVSLMETDVNSVGMLIGCYRALGDEAGVRRSAEFALNRAEAILARDQNNSSALVYGAYALASLGESERAKTRMNRALVVDPDNWDMRYNFACALNGHLKDKEAALEMLKPLFVKITSPLLRYMKVDPDLESLQDDARYQALIAAAEARLAAIKGTSDGSKQDA